MAAERRYYVDGNTARAYTEYSPERRREEELLTDGRILSMPEKAAQPSILAQLPFAILLLTATVLFAVLCYNYLNVQASIKSTASAITVLENELAELRADNDVAENRLNASVDLDRVYRIATEELGMVYPNGNERITYEAQVREYVRQYEPIPAG